MMFRSAIRLSAVALILTVLAPFAIAEPLFFGTTAVAAGTATTVTAGAAFPAAVALGAAAVGTALLIGAVANSRGSRRGKRAVLSGMCPTDNNDDLLSIAAKTDAFDCGRRFVCEVAATNESLNAQEESIRSLFLDEEATGSGRRYFSAAAQIGQLMGMPKCEEVFPACPYSKKDLFSIYEKEIIA